MKTIEVTDEMHDFLMELSKELTTQDNRCTAMPYFFQIQETVEVPTGDGMGDEEVWVCDGEICLRDEVDIKEAIFEYKEWDLEDKDHQKEYDDLDSYDRDEVLEHNYQKFNVTTHHTYKKCIPNSKSV